MNRKKERFVETFVTVMFPVALLVACTTNGTDNPATTQTPVKVTQIEFNNSQPDATSDGIEDVLVDHTNTDDEELNWSVSKSEDNQYVMVSPSLHLAIYKTEAKDVKKSDDIQQVKMKEQPATPAPEKSVFHFDSDNYNLNKQDLDYLKKHAEFLKRNQELTLTISGHTDHTGSMEYNQKLSEQRAQLVADILLTYGVPQSQLIVDGYGETVPVHSVENLEENRRVELQYSQPLMVSTM